MKMIKKTVIGAAVVFLSLSAIVHAQQAPLSGHGPIGMMGQGFMGNGMDPGMEYGQMIQNQMMSSNASMKLMQQLMTPAEHLALMDKMVESKSWEERQTILTATQAEMEKRAKEKGISMPIGFGFHIKFSKNCG